jgi:hypothetical protein
MDLQALEKDSESLGFLTVTAKGFPPIFSCQIALKRVG